MPEPKPGQKGKRAEKKQVVNGVRSQSVEQVGKAEDTNWQKPRIRTNERGVLEDRFAARRVWVWDARHIKNGW